jgi:hypothetical protein
MDALVAGAGSGRSLRDYRGRSIETLAHSNTCIQSIAYRYGVTVVVVV